MDLAASAAWAITGMRLKPRRLTTEPPANCMANLPHSTSRRRLEMDVRIKSLEWKEGNPFVWYVADLYRIEDNGTNWKEDRYWLFIVNERSKYPTLEAAKAAAQSDYERRILSALTESLAVAGVTEDWLQFKNFHRLLCERFNYCHDEKDWYRDQVSLIEHIAALSSPAEGGSQLAMPSDPDWYERKAKLEAGHEIGAGRKTSTVNLTAEEVAEFDRLQFEALPKWARDEITRLRSSPAEGGEKAVRALSRLLDACIREFGWFPEADPNTRCGTDHECEVRWGDLFAAHNEIGRAS